MHTVIIVIHLMVVLALTGLVLLQKSEGGGLGMGGRGGFMTSRGTSNVLSRSTGILAGVFFATSLILSILAGMDRKPRSILNDGATAPLTAPSPIPLGSSRPATAPAGSAPIGANTAPAGSPSPESSAPASPSPAPAAPAVPSGPQVPQSQ